MVHGKRV